MHHVIKVSLDTEPYESKPLGNEVNQISRRIARNPEALKCPVSIQEFVYDVGVHGKTFSPASFRNGKRNEENFEQMQLLVLDFDGKISYKEVRERALKYNLPILFAYDTFSSSYDLFYEKYTDERFRIAFLNDVPITDKRAAKIMKNMLRTIYPESDKNDSDISRMYYGGKLLRRFDQRIQTVDMESLTRNMAHYLSDTYGETNYKRKITEFSKLNGVSLDKKGFLDIIREEIPDNIPESVPDGLSDNILDIIPDSSDNTMAPNLITEESSGASHDNKNLPNPIIINDKFIIVKGIGNKLSNYQYRINLIHDSTNGHYVVNDNDIRKKRRPHRSDVLDEIGDVCRLFREFRDGNKPSHDEIFGLATNMIQIESGAEKFMEILYNNSYFKDRKFKYDLWVKDLRYMRRTDYHPRSCNTFCPYTDECSHGKNILSTVKLKFPIRIAGYVENLAPIDEVERELDKTLDSFLKSKDTKLNAICAQTAIGKTRAFIKRLSISTLVIFAPTNGLKRELYDRAKGDSIDDIIVSPSLHELDLPDNIERKINKYYSAGNHKSVVPYLKRIVGKEDGGDSGGVKSIKAAKNSKTTKTTKATINPNNAPYVNDIRKYISEREAFFNSECSAVTTHKNYPLLNIKQLNKYSAAIIDEDITLKSIIPNQINIPLSKLEIVLKKDIPKELAEKIRLALKSAKTKDRNESFFELPEVGFDDERLEGISTGIDIPSFCKATRFFINKSSDEKNLHEDNLSNSIIFYASQDLKPKIPTVMVSATMNEAICRYVFGDINFHKCKTAKYKGTLYQYPRHSMSRAFIDKDLGVFERITKLTKVEDIITFKKYHKGSLYFGNTDGRDIYKGKDLNVIGTPHQPEWIYKLFAYTFGLDFDPSARLIPNRQVEHNGYRFRISTYEDEILRNIQFYMIESELEQAVGRARLLRCDCTVHLFSNFPLRQGVMREDYF